MDRSSCTAILCVRYCMILALLLLLRIEVLLDLNQLILLILMGAETREQMQSVSDVFEVVIII